MKKEGRQKQADQYSLVRDGAMMFRQIGFSDRAEKLDMVFHVCGNYEKKLVKTGRDISATNIENSESLCN